MSYLELKHSWLSIPAYASGWKETRARGKLSALFHSPQIQREKNIRLIHKSSLKNMYSVKSPSCFLPLLLQVSESENQGQISPFSTRSESRYSGQQCTYVRKRQETMLLNKGIPLSEANKTKMKTSNILHLASETETKNY